jgi:tRNA pseudouridine38-40 synthase
VAYDGSPFHGFAAQNPSVPTVVGALSHALSLIARVPVTLSGAGRTDTGVHAWGQVVTCDLPVEMRVHGSHVVPTDLTDVARRVNSMCGPALVVRSAEWAPDGEFHARFSARWRHYRYTVLNASAPNPFLAATAWHVHRALSLPALQLACDPLIGEHDFTTFCRKPPPVPAGASVTGGAEPEREEGDAAVAEPSMSRYVMLASWTDVSEEFAPYTTDQRVLRFDIRANAFCHQMVRSIVGMMIQVGTGALHAGQIRGIMLARNRSRAASLAPPHGLCLWEVGY